MKRARLILMSVLFLMQATAFGQQKTVFGDEVGTLDGIMKAYYEVVSVKKGEKISYPRDSALHAPKALVGLPARTKEGKFYMKLVSLKEYHLMSDAGLEKDGFDEKEISRKVESFGAMYHVWSTYESRNVADGPLIDRGINSIELYFDGTRFWITSWSFENESKDQKIPLKYLTIKEQ
ncbi:MAG: hypothetical protein IPI66_09355 [Chitinophagaceae bacterium]|nr:hypothetical protein [Chitinophagaceae bacterium]MBL0057426.1 hypothetical protein [Chitinophagaceae bacterium]